MLIQLELNYGIRVKIERSIMLNFNIVKDVTFR